MAPQEVENMAATEPGNGESTLFVIDYLYNTSCPTNSLHSALIVLEVEHTWVVSLCVVMTEFEIDSIPLLCARADPGIIRHTRGL